MTIVFLPHLLHLGCLCAYHVIDTSVFTPQLDYFSHISLHQLHQLHQCKMVICLTPLFESVNRCLSKVIFFLILFLLLAGRYDSCITNQSHLHINGAFYGTFYDRYHIQVVSHIHSFNYRTKIVYSNRGLMCICIVSRLRLSVWLANVFLHRAIISDKHIGIYVIWDGHID